MSIPAIWLDDPPADDLDEAVMSLACARRMAGWPDNTAEKQRVADGLVVFWRREVGVLVRAAMGVEA